MKVFYKYPTLLLLLGFLFFSYLGQAQIRIYEEGSYVKAEITPEDKDVIMQTATRVLNDYVRVASFMNSDGEFSDDSYAEFVGLFSGSAEVYDDLAKKNGGNINYSSYADKVFQYMQGTGVRFELNETYLDEIVYDSSGFYQVFLSFQKIMFNGLDDDMEIVNFPNNGKVNELKMGIEIPSYDLTYGSIMSILGESKKVKVESANMISVDLNYHLGNVSKTASLLTPGWSNDLPVSYNSYGVDVVYRRSMNSKKSIYLLAGASAGFHNFTSDLSEISAEGKAAISSKIGGAGINPDGVPRDASYIAIQQIVSGVDENNLIENLQVIDIQVPLGISLRLVETYNWDIFMDVAVVPTYSIASSGRYSGNLKYIKLPEDQTHFSEKFIEDIKAKAAAGFDNPAYYGTVSFDEELVQTASNFSAAAQVTPLFHYKFNFKMAFELGLNVSYGFLPYFKNETNHLGTEQSRILEIVDKSGAENPSLLQNNYKDVGILRYGARAGIVFKL